MVITEPEVVTAAAPPTTQFRVQLAIPASLSKADVAWAVENPEEVDGALGAWYRHGRRCRRFAQRRGDGLQTGLRECRCIA